MILIEAMEPRRLRTVTVEETYLGFYEIHGGEQADVIEASVSSADETLTVDGVTYGGVAFVSIYGHGGDDTISVGSADAFGWIGAVAEGGAGHDTITISLDGSAWGGPGDDRIYLGDAFRGQAIGGPGNDGIHVSGGCIDPQILGGPGDDVIDASANLYGVVIDGGGGDDRIYGTAHDDQIYGGDGNDTLGGGGGVDFFDDDGCDVILGDHDLTSAVQIPQA